MKKTTLVSLLLFISFFSVAQSDTLYMQKNKKVACKIYEIGEYEIKYKRVDALEGPIYFIDKSTVVKYCLASGFCETITFDELSLEHEHKEILGNRQVIKINPFSFAFNHVGVAYEKVIKIGMNLDIEAGYINSNINTSENIFGTGNYSKILKTGFYFKPGVKFFLGQDFAVKGLKYAHPLKGRYIKLDLAISNVNYNDVSRTYNSGSIYNPQTQTYSQAYSQTVYTDIRTVAYGGFVNFGRQFILGNLFTLEYYYGVGFTAQSISYTNSSFNANPYGTNYGNNNYPNGYIPEIGNTSNYHTFFRNASTGISVTGGFRLGYIIPEHTKKSNSKQVKK